MPKTKDVPRKPLPAGIGKVLKRLHYPLDVIVLCVRWYVAYSLSLRNLEEMMAERGIEVDHSSVHRWVIKLVPLFEKAFRRHKRPVGKSWRMDETYVKVKGQWKYRYRAVDRQGNTVDFLLRAHRDKAAARRYFEKAIDQNGEPGLRPTNCRWRSAASFSASRASSTRRWST
jgi:putative transposase